MKFNYRMEQKGKTIFVETSYHSFFPAFARHYGGRYNQTTKRWVFRNANPDVIETMLEEYRVNAENGKRPEFTI